MANWTKNQVSNWLKDNGFEKYAATFYEQEINGEAMIGLTENDIGELLAETNPD
ncbi:unnamed protein product, partial [Rotaria magnacalcarata]